MKVKRKIAGQSSALTSELPITSASTSTGLLGTSVNRRTFLKNSGLTAGGAASPTPGGE